MEVEITKLCFLVFSDADLNEKPHCLTEEYEYLEHKSGKIFLKNIETGCIQMREFPDKILSS